MGATGAAIAVVLSLAVKPLMPSTPDIWEIRGDLFTGLFDCELFLAMLYASNRLGLIWRNHVMGVAQGLTIWAFWSRRQQYRTRYLWLVAKFFIFEHLLMFLYLGTFVR